MLKLAPINFFPQKPTDYDETHLLDVGQILPAYRLNLYASKAVRVSVSTL